MSFKFLVNSPLLLFIVIDITLLNNFHTVFMTYNGSLQTKFICWILPGGGDGEGVDNVRDHRSPQSFEDCWGLLSRC